MWTKHPHNQTKKAPLQHAVTTAGQHGFVLVASRRHTRIVSSCEQRPRLLTMAVHISMKVNRNVPRRFRLSPLYPKRENAPMSKDEERQQGDNQILADLIVMYDLHDCTREGDTGCSKRQSLEQVAVLSLPVLMAGALGAKLAGCEGVEPPWDFWSPSGFRPEALTDSSQHPKIMATALQ